MLHTSSKAYFQCFCGVLLYIARTLLEEQASAVPVEAKDFEFIVGYHHKHNSRNANLDGN
jgi:hypothetical protein